MGIQGYRTFEDAAACDWLDALTGTAGIGFLERSLLPADDVDGAALDMADAVGIVAAAEIVYGLLNGPREGVPAKGGAWIEANRQVDAACLKPVCERQLGRVLSEESALCRTWKAKAEEAYLEWKGQVEGLLRALTD